MKNTELTHKQLELINKIKNMSNEELTIFIDFCLKEIDQLD